MSVKPNGTDAKDIVLHFVELFVKRATPREFAKMMNQAKSILDSGYNKEEIIDVITHLRSKPNLNIYSLGYVSACIKDTLRELEQLKTEEELKAVQEEIKSKVEEHYHTQSNEVKTCGDSTKRNQTKLSRFGLQPRFGEKLDFDMFEKHRQDN